MGRRRDFPWSHRRGQGGKEVMFISGGRLQVCVVEVFGLDEGVEIRFL